MVKTNAYIDKYKDEIDKAIEHYKNELRQLRTGRASVTLVENILVESYGVITPLKQLASISVPESTTISIEPWDKNILKEIEKAIANSSLAINPLNTGDLIMVKLPPMTEEKRQEVVKVLNQKTEEAKISLRQIRDKIKEDIQKAEANKEIGEDEKFRYLDEMDSYIKEETGEIDELKEHKEKEIMTI